MWRLGILDHVIPPVAAYLESQGYPRQEVGVSGSEGDSNGVAEPEVLFAMLRRLDGMYAAGAVAGGKGWGWYLPTDLWAVALAGPLALQLALARSRCGGGGGPSLVGSGGGGGGGGGAGLGSVSQAAWDTAVTQTMARLTSQCKVFGGPRSMDKGESGLSTTRLSAPPLVGRAAGYRAAQMMMGWISRSAGDHRLRLAAAGR